MIISAHHQATVDKTVVSILGSTTAAGEPPPSPDNIKQTSTLQKQDLLSTLSRWQQLLGMLRRFTAGHRRFLSRGMLAAVGVTLLRLALPWPLQALLLPLLQGEQVVSPVWIPAGLNVSLVAGALLAVILALLGYVDSRVRLNFARFSIGTIRDLRKEALRGLSCGPQPGSPTRSGDMVARLVGDTARVKAGLKGFLVHVAVNGLLLMGITAVMLYIDVTIGILFGLCIAAVFAVTIFGARNIYETAAKYRRKEGYLAHAIIKLAKFARRAPDNIAPLASMPRKVLASYKKANLSSGRSEARITQLTGYATWAAHALLGLFVFVALLYGAQAMEAGTLSSASLLLFAFYILSARTPMVQLARQGVRTGKILACLGRLDDLLESPGSASKTPTVSP